MKIPLRGYVIVNYKYKDKSTIFSFSLGNKMQWAMRKSLRSAYASQDFHVTHYILFPHEIVKIVFQSLNETRIKLKD